MPNGKPGDHPITDIVVHRSRVFGEPFDDLIREIDRVARPADRELLGTLVMFWPKLPNYEPVDPMAFELVLKALKRRAEA